MVIHNGAEKAGGGADSRLCGNENIDAKGEGLGPKSVAFAPHSLT